MKKVSTLLNDKEPLIPFTCGKGSLQVTATTSPYYTTIQTGIDWNFAIARGLSWGSSNPATAAYPNGSFTMMLTDSITSAFGASYVSNSVPFFKAEKSGNNILLYYQKKPSGFIISETRNWLAGLGMVRNENLIPFFKHFVEWEGYTIRY